jgi:hypothetical protein
MCDKDILQIGQGSLYPALYRLEYKGWIMGRRHTNASRLPVCGHYPGTPRYGIGGLGTGATPQIVDAHGGRGGVGIRNSLPWVAAEPPLMQAPV